MSNKYMDEINAQDWEILVKSELDFLISADKFHITKNMYSPEAFGNRLTKLESDNYAISVEYDRSRLHIWIKSKSDPPFRETLATMVGYVTNQSFLDIEDFSEDDQNQFIHKARLFRNIIKKYLN